MMADDWILIATVGLPRSGKSTWSRVQTWPIVNPDAIRLAIHGERFNAQAEPFVWLVAKTMIRALFLAGHNVVILDATNTTRKRRDDLRSVEWETYFKVIDTPKGVCLYRAISENDTEIIPVIERMAAGYEPLEADEREWP
jgi:predicted kinase